jgi:hypothetical protein
MECLQQFVVAESAVEQAHLSRVAVKVFYQHDPARLQSPLDAFGQIA